jgi:hypothetical protein
MKVFEAGLGSSSIEAFFKIQLEQIVFTGLSIRFFSWLHLILRGIYVLEWIPYLVRLALNKADSSTTKTLFTSLSVYRSCFKIWVLSENESANTLVDCLCQSFVPMPIFKGKVFLFCDFTLFFQFISARSQVTCHILVLAAKFSSV